MTRGRMPVVFVGHGNPMNAIEQNRFNQSWRRLAERLPEPDAILCISAHWETARPGVTASAQPETVHDFAGFPRALFDVRYPAPGAPTLARRVVALLAEEDCRADPERGLDHGAWGVLHPMYPDARVPVAQLSLTLGKSPVWHDALARKLAPLRDENVLILCSGNIVHNLSLFDRSSPMPAAYDWAKDFDDAICRAVETGDQRTIINFVEMGGHARLAVPTPEHYLPLLYACALRQADDSVAFFNRDVLSSISMSSCVLGGAAA